MTFEATYTAVVDLQSRYAITLDRGDADGLRACFTDDAVLSVDGEVRAEGGDAIAERLLARAPAGVMHLTLNTTVDGTRATSYFLLLEGGALTAAGDYSDEVELDPDGRARFRARDVTYRWRS
jgi:hypothetical protein